MGVTPPAGRLLGRGSEQGLIASQLAAARGGRRGLLLIRGEPGIGKTALLGWAAASADGMRVTRAAGAEAEMELPYAGLQQLCAPLLGGLAKLPGPQRDALRTAFGLSDGPAPDRLMVGLATLSLLSTAGQRQPLLCVVDDLHWIDRVSAQALLFVAHRLHADRVGLIIATREAEDDFTGLPELPLQGLPDDSARVLLDSVLLGRIDDRVRERILAEARGNPLALLELPRGPVPAELLAESSSRDIPARVEESFQRRVSALPQATRLLLLVAAAEPSGDPLLLWRAAGVLGLTPDTAVAAQDDGLLSVGTRVLFHHPLVRSAVYRAALPAQRRAAHRALAEATDPATDPDRRAWHRALAADGPDEGAAFELERSADRAQARAGLAAAAAFLERSTILTPEPGRRSRRALAAAQAKQEAGAFDAALALLAATEASPLDELQRAQAELVRGQIAFATSHWSQAVRLLLSAARQFEPLDVRMSRDTYLRVIAPALMGAALADDRDLRDAVTAARQAPPALPPLSRDLLLDAIAVLVDEGYPAGADAVQRALHACLDERVPDVGASPWAIVAIDMAALVWNDESWRTLTARAANAARDLGALGTLPIALSMSANERLFAGDLAETAALAGEANEISKAIGSRLVTYGAVALAAWRGDEARAVPVIEAGAKDLADKNDSSGLPFIRWATAVLYNGLGQYEQALGPSGCADEYLPAHRFSSFLQPEIIEAAVRCGQAGRAADALGRLSAHTRACGTDWALGTEACARALLSDGESAERLYLEAIERLGRTSQRPATARARLVYGEWLRRQRRRSDARDQLRRAYAEFAGIGMEAFAERARIELEATGEHARRRAAGPRDELTPQEAQIARMAAAGATNAEIAAQLFLSPNTVAYHLRTSFGKLGVTTRRQLAKVLAG